VTIDELERDPHGVFRRYRRQFPFIKRADGTALVLRDGDVQQPFTDPRTRVASVSRFALEDIELDGYVLNAGLHDAFDYVGETR
jgi:hypothetical protein